MKSFISLICISFILIALNTSCEKEAPIVPEGAIIRKQSADEHNIVSNEEQGTKKSIIGNIR
ncbi:MAG: hypothetical protein IPM71_05405 [Bacteroidota bacterium]|nr:MAG: hypothetical protein IPM71_05405 [Bacteroidota bacterium]